MFSSSLTTTKRKTSNAVPTAASAHGGSTEEVLSFVQRQQEQQQEEQNGKMTFFDGIRFSRCVNNSNGNNRGRTTSFPMKLHLMLDSAEECGHSNIVSWMPGGKSFKIHDPDGMVTILQVYFNQTRYKSFLRQLQNYGFHRVIRGPEKGTCTHEHFVQSNYALCLLMKKGAYNNNNNTNNNNIVINHITSTTNHAHEDAVPTMDASNQARPSHQRPPQALSSYGNSINEMDADATLTTADSAAMRMAIMMSQGHCLNLSSAQQQQWASLNSSSNNSRNSHHQITAALLLQKEDPLHHDVITRSNIATFADQTTISDKNTTNLDGMVEASSSCWMTKLLNNQDLWMIPQKSSQQQQQQYDHCWNEQQKISSSNDDIFEPNHVIFPEDKKLTTEDDDKVFYALPYGQIAFAASAIATTTTANAMKADAYAMYNGLMTAAATAATVVVDDDIFSTSSTTNNKMNNNNKAVNSSSISGGVYPPEVICFQPTTTPTTRSGNNSMRMGVFSSYTSDFSHSMEDDIYLE